MLLISYETLQMYFFIFNTRNGRNLQDEENVTFYRYKNRSIVLSNCQKVNRVSSKDHWVDCLARPKQRNTDLAQ